MMWIAAFLAPVVLVAAADDASVARGEKIFAQQCASAPCHGSAGTAGRGPQLRARKLEHDPVLKVVENGSGSMAAFSKLSQADREAVTAYVLSLQNLPAPTDSGAAAPPAEFKGPEPARRGFALFFDASKATSCGVCHVIKGRGTAVGPDLTRLARMSPRAFAMSITSTRTAYAIILKPKGGKEFPAMKVEQAEGIQVYDLSQTPPVLRKFQKDEVASMVDNNVWKHPPATEEYSPAQLADIISYIRYAAYGDTSGVKAADLE